MMEMVYRGDAPLLMLSIIYPLYLWSGKIEKPMDTMVLYISLSKYNDKDVNYEKRAEK